MGSKTARSRERGKERERGGRKNEGGEGEGKGGGGGGGREIKREGFKMGLAVPHEVRREIKGVGRL